MRVCVYVCVCVCLCVYVCVRVCMVVNKTIDMFAAGAVPSKIILVILFRTSKTIKVTLTLKCMGAL